MRTTAILSDLELNILGCIRQEAQTGYAVRKTLQASPGAIYPALKRLAAAGLIEGKAEGNRKREVFQATAAGRRALRESLSRPTLEELRRDPQSVAGRLRYLDGPAAAAFLDDYARLSAECAAELKGRTGLIAGHDAAVYAARSKWAAAAARRIRGG